MARNICGPRDGLKAHLLYPYPRTTGNRIVFFREIIIFKFTDKFLNATFVPSGFDFVDSLVILLCTRCTNMCSLQRLATSRKRSLPCIVLWSSRFLLFFFFFFFYYYYYYYCLNLYFYATLVERENGFRSFRFLITRESLESREMKITYNYRWDRRPPLSSTIKRVRNGTCLETVCACSNVHNITVILRYFFERGKGKKKKINRR